ncbi:MAG TPA: histone deacetylase, partial [Archangium sp.]
SARQGRFEALVRDLKKVPLLDATRALASGKVLLNGQPYLWEADEMVRWRDEKDIPQDKEARAAERERCHFTL